MIGVDIEKSRTAATTAPSLEAQVFDLDLVSVNGELGKAIKRVRKHSDLLVLLGDRWPEAARVPLHWDHDNRVLATEQARPTYGALFGNRMLRTGRHLVRALVDRQKAESWEGWLDVPFSLPRDAIILPRSNRGPVVASASAGRILKILRPRDRQRWTSETEALAVAQSDDLRYHVPTLFDYGIDEADGICWTMMELVPNRTPFVTRWDFARRRTWRRWLEERILPFMCAYYRAAGIQWVNPDDLLEASVRRMETLDLSEGPPALADMVEKARPANGGSRIPVSQIHGDLTPVHVHRKGSRWWLIDWGDSKRAELFYELFRTRLGSPRMCVPRHRAFWDWLAGRKALEQLPADCRKDIWLYLWVVNTQLGTDTSPEQLRYQILSVALRGLVKEWGSRAEDGRLPERPTLEGSGRGAFGNSVAQLVALGLLPSA